MAINFGDILGGLGAAYGGRAQEYAQGIQQREQGLTEQKRAELEARQRAMYEDANTAFGFLSNPELNYEQRADNIIRLAEDRLDALSNYPDADPSDTLQVLELANQMKDGTDPTAVTRLAQILTPAYQIYKQRYAPQQEQERGVVVDGKLIGQTTGRVMYEGQPQAAEIIPSSSVTDGQIITRDSSGNFVASTPRNLMEAPVDELRQLQIDAAQRAADQALIAPQTAASAQNVEMNLARLKRLSETAVSRTANIEKATEFLDAFVNQGARSGRGRALAGYLPTFTAQGKFDEAFNAFAEVAAREQLKATGETRPTDADVKGMKESMFGIGRDEAVNMRLLEDFIRQQTVAENEFQQLRAAQQSNQLGVVMPAIALPPTQLSPMIEGGGQAPLGSQENPIRGMVIRDGGQGLPSSVLSDQSVLNEADAIVGRSGR